jgi:hypothetical protein
MYKIYLQKIVSRQNNKDEKQSLSKQLYYLHLVLGDTWVIIETLQLKRKVYYL